MNRRSFLLGAAVSLVAAPAIVRVASIMPVKALPVTEGFNAPGLYLYGFDAYGDSITEFIPLGGRGHVRFREIADRVYLFEPQPCSFAT